MDGNRSIATDALGLLLAVIVCAASVHENNAGIRVLNQAKAHHPTIAKTCVPLPGHGERVWRLADLGDLGDLGDLAISLDRGASSA